MTDCGIRPSRLAWPVGVSAGLPLHPDATLDDHLDVSNCAAGAGPPGDTPEALC